LLGALLSSGHAQRYRQLLAAKGWLMGDYCNVLLPHLVNR
jgi:hypothetical protein